MCSMHGDIRYDPCELGAQGSARPKPRAPRIDPEQDQEEFLGDKEPQMTPDEPDVR